MVPGELLIRSKGDPLPVSGYGHIGSSPVPGGPPHARMGWASQVGVLWEVVYVGTEEADLIRRVGQSSYPTIRLTRSQIVAEFETLDGQTVVA